MPYNTEKVKLALNILYGGGVRDLTPEGYQKVLAQLKSVDPKAARRVEVTLEPYLREKIFPRRKVGWLNSSQGLRARLALLPKNPHLKTDVKVVRRVLGIPSDHVKPNEEDPLWKEIISSRIKLKSIRKVWEGKMAGWWHGTHCLLATGKSNKFSDEELYGPLSEAMRRSASKSAKIQFTNRNVPEWLKQPPSGKAPYDSTGAPLDRAVGRLVERYRLPWHAALPLTTYVLTENPAWIEDIEWLSVSGSSSSYRPYETTAFHIAIEGIDEFVTVSDWKKLWDLYIKPVQEEAWRERAKRPQGRRNIDPVRLKKFLPLYRKAIPYKNFNEFITKVGHFDKAYEKMDEETIRLALKDLKELLQPGN